MKKMISILMILILISLVGVSSFAEEVTNNTNYDDSNIKNGTINVRYLSAGDARIKTRLQKDDKNYTYDLFGKDTFESFPTQMGNGEYTVSVFENVIDNRYRVVDKKTMTVTVENIFNIFKNSIQTVNWNPDRKTIEKAEELCKNLKTDKEKISVIYQYVIKNFSYDYEKIKGLDSSYVPNIDQIFIDKKGICYDYAAVFSSMLRSQDISVKLIKGYTTAVPEFHAWNEVYLTAEKRWIVVDTTFDSVYVKAGYKTKLEKDAKQYTMSQEY